MPGRYLGTLVVIELATAALVSWSLDVPTKLPGVALDSALLFSGYRGLLMFLALYVVTVIVTWSFTGSLASKVGTGGIEWGNKDAAGAATEQMLKLNLRLDDQQDFVQSVMVRLIEDRSHSDNLDRLIRRVDGDVQRIALDLAQLRRKQE